MFKSTNDFALTDFYTSRHEEICGDLIELGVLPEHRIVDFGCGTGALVYEFHRRGFQDAVGIGTNWFSIDFGRGKFHLCEDDLRYFDGESVGKPCDWMFALDIFQKIGVLELEGIVKNLAAKRLIVRVPVSPKEGYDYFCESDQDNRENIICHIREWWIEFLDVKYQFVCKVFGNKLVDSEGTFVGLFYAKE